MRQAYWLWQSFSNLISVCFVVGYIHVCCMLIKIYLSDFHNTNVQLLISHSEGVVGEAEEIENGTLKVTWNF